MPTLRERALAAFAGASSVNRKLIVLMLLIVVAVASVLVALNSAKPYRAAAASRSDSVSSAWPSSAAVQSATLYVHVVGEIRKPGIYELDSGSRIFDLVFAAGGFTEKADQASVNLAREITDGEQIVVLPIGVAATTSSGTAAGALISLNRASQSELEALPGVGPALASRMIDWRTTNGGFKRKDDLLKVSGIGQKMFAAIEKLVTL